MRKTMRFTAILLMMTVVMCGCGGNEEEHADVAENGQSRYGEKQITEKEENSEGNIKKEKTLEEIFSEYKEKCIEEANKLPLEDEYTEICLKRFEDSYIKMINLKDITEDNEFLSEFVTAISYLYAKFDEETLGRNVGEKGWEAIKSLYIEDGLYEEKMQELKEAYEEAGHKIFLEKYNSGQYKVGTDIESGEYVFFANSSSGYFCVSSDANGNDIIANENFSYNSIMTVQEGEYLELSRCYAVPISEVTELPIDKADMFKIGVHLPAGEYKLTSDGDRGYYCIYSDNRQDDIEANDNFDGQSYVTVLDGQYLKLSRCHIEQ